VEKDDLRQRPYVGGIPLLLREAEQPPAVVDRIAS